MEHSNANNQPFGSFLQSDENKFTVPVPQDSSYYTQSTLQPMLGNDHEGYNTTPAHAYKSRDYEKLDTEPQYEQGALGGIYNPGPVFSYEKVSVPPLPKQNYKFFDNVHVALVSWKCEPGKDDVPELEGEVAALCLIFESLYKFRTTRIKISTKEQDPTRYLEDRVKAMCERLLKSSGKRKCFILAYGGHGSESAELSAEVSQFENNASFLFTATSEGPDLDWKPVQKLIIKSKYNFSKFFFLDSCYAGLAMMTIKKSQPAVDWICAADAKTSSDSEWSCTKALIEALQDLDGRSFTVESLFALIHNTRIYKDATERCYHVAYIHESQGGYGKEFVFRALN